ncbi:MAG: archaellin/type IV pilin N-terminal domain-containing protein, partial [Nanoarchaeota archaeon]
MENKRALSDVVTTVLIILFAIVAVAIIGGIVLSQVNKAGGKIDSSAICSEFQVTPVKCTAGDASNPATLMIRRDSGGKGFSVSSIK